MRILLGHISTAHGVRGDVVIKSLTEDPADIATYGPLSDEDGQRQFDIKVVRVTNKGVIARVAGVTDRNAAEALRGTKLYVDRHKLPALEADEVYHTDIIGLIARRGDGSEVGEIVAVQNFGAGDLLEIRLAVPTSKLDGDYHAAFRSPFLGPAHRCGIRRAERGVAAQRTAKAFGLKQDLDFVKQGERRRRRV